MSASSSRSTLWTLFNGLSVLRLPGPRHTTYVKLAIIATVAVTIVTVLRRQMYNTESKLASSSADNPLDRVFAELRKKSTQKKPESTVHLGYVAKNPSNKRSPMSITEALRVKNYKVVWFHPQAKYIISAPHSLNGFVYACHNAFMDHHGIEITPDMIWFILAQQIATYINFDENSKKLAGKLGISHQGKEEILIMSESVPLNSKDFSTSYARFAQAILDRVGHDKYELFVKMFSTTTDLEFGAFQIVLMDAYQSYFEYTESTRCGISEFHITGTDKDFIQIINGIKKFAELDSELSTWATKAIQLVDKFRSAVTGSFDQTYFNSFYHWKSRSGCSEVTGHIKDLFLFKQTKEGISLLNESDTLELGNFPTCISKAPFKYLDDKDYLLEFLSGCVGHEFIDGICRPNMFTSVVYQK